MIDPLTEMYNRRYMIRAIASGDLRADRQNSLFAFLMIDVNEFKQANDALGHLAGDQILRELAVLLRKTFRTSDIISRFGGDEFLVLLVDSNAQMAARAAERLQEAVSEWNKGEPIRGIYHVGKLRFGGVSKGRGRDGSSDGGGSQAMYRRKRRCRMNCKKRPRRRLELLSCPTLFPSAPLA